MRPIGSVWLTGATALVAGTIAAAVTLTHHHSGAHVLGEKIVGAGTSTVGPSGSTTGGGDGGANATGASKPNGGNNGNGNGGKTFTISGSISGLYPGGEVHLKLYITNPNQDMNVTALSAKLKSITTASGVADTCTPGLTVGRWTGQQFLVLRNAVNQPAPGYIPVSMAKTSNQACAGATFNFTYAGTGSQA